MQQQTSRWELLERLVSEHRLFRDHENGSIAVADKSGPTPDRTDDGVMWLDLSKPATLVYFPDGKFLAVQVSVRGPRLSEGCWIGVDLADIPTLQRYGIKTFVHDSARPLYDAWKAAMPLLYVKGR